MAVQTHLWCSTALALPLLRVATASPGLQQPVFDCVGSGAGATTDEGSMAAITPAWVQRAWCCRHRGLGCIAVAGPPKKLEDAGFAVLALAKRDYESHEDRPKELAVQAGDVLWVRRSMGGTWAFARNKHRGQGWVPNSVLSFARPAAVSSDFTPSSWASWHQPLPQISAKLGDPVWIVETSRHTANWSWAMRDEQEGWLPNWALQVHVDKTLTAAAPAMVSRDFDADARARHRQLSVNNGEMVLAGGKLESATWVFALDMDGRRGWVPGGVLQALQAAVVLEPFHARAASGGPQPKVPAFQGHTVWVSSRNDSGWIFVSSQGREGWIPAGAILGNSTLASTAAKVHAGILVAGLVGLMLAACSIAAVFAHDTSLRQRVMATLPNNNLHCELPLVDSEQGGVFDESHDRLLSQVGATPRYDVVRQLSGASREGSAASSRVPSNHSEPGWMTTVPMGRENSMRSARSLYGGLDAQSFSDSRSEITGNLSSRSSPSPRATSRNSQGAMYHEAVRMPRSKSFGEEVTFYM